MFEFNKLCDEFESLSAAERSILLAEKSVSILARLHCLAIPQIDPVRVLAGFIIGSAAADGRINEKEYLIMYPSLVRVFGADFDFDAVKALFLHDRSGRRAIAEYTENMLCVLNALDSEVKRDVIMLCLCIVSIDGRVGLREKHYIRRLCEAE